MTRSTLPRRLVALLLAVLLVTAMAGVGPPVAAQSDDDGFGPFDWFGDDESDSEGDDEGLLATIESIASTAADLPGIALERSESALDAHVPGYGDDPPADTIASDLTTWFNDRNGTIREYANDRIPSDTNKTNYDVIAVVVHDEDEDSAVRYVVGDVNQSTGNFSSLQAVNSTDRSVDYTVSLSPTASEDLQSEAQTLYDDYVNPNEAIDRATVRSLAGEYAGKIEYEQGDAVEEFR